MTNRIGKAALAAHVYTYSTPHTADSKKEDVGEI